MNKKFLAVILIIAGYVGVSLGMHLQSLDAQSSEETAKIHGDLMI